MRSDDPPRGPGRPPGVPGPGPWRSSGPRRDDGRGAGPGTGREHGRERDAQRGAGGAAERGFGREDERRSGTGQRPFQRDAGAPASRGAQRGGFGEGSREGSREGLGEGERPAHRGSHAHPHSRSERREQRHRHGEDEREPRERPRGGRDLRERHGREHALRDRDELAFGEDIAGADPTAAPRPRRDAELRLYGLNAVRAVFARRPEAIRKLYLDGPRIPQLQPVLAWCVANRVGYRVVESADLDRLAASNHHEGVVADVLREEPAPLSHWLRDLAAGPQLALWLDGVGNPHNFGAILRSAAHFGVGAVLLPKDAGLALSGAAARVAEGGAEAVPMVRLGRGDNAIAQLRSAGFALAATVVEGGSNLFAAELPPRLVYVLGAEGPGMDRELAAACDLRLSIPGTGRVESLNVAAATAVLLAAWSAQR